MPLPSQPSGPASGTPPAPSSGGQVPDPRIGSTLGQGKYRITGKLGQGGMGVVYEAEDLRLQRRVAVKLLPDTVSGNPDALERFLREARAAGRLNHPNVVAVLDVDQRDGDTYIVMELVRGGSVADLVAKRGPLPWQQATRVVADVCRGLVAAHAVGLIHRDIKPANILLQAQESKRQVRVKLADFGLAKMVDHTGTSLTNTGSVVGTPDYMSPEQCRSERLDDRSDIYSLGASYFKLLTGRAPFAAETPLQILFAHCEKPVPDPRSLVPEIPEACAAVIQRAMAKEPSARFQSSVELLAALSGLLGKTASVTAPLPAVPPEPGANEATMAMQVPLAVPVRAGKRRWLRVGALAALVLLAALLFFVIRSPSGSPPVRQTGQAAQTGPTLPAGERLPEPGLALDIGGRVESIAFSPDGKWFAAAAGDGAGGVRVWDVQTRQQVMHLWKGQGSHSIVFSSSNELRELVAGLPGGLGHWVLGSPAPLLLDKVDGGEVAALADSPLNRGFILFAVNPKTGAGRVAFRGATPKPLEPALVGLPGPISCLAVSADGKMLAAGGKRPSFVRIWNLETAEQIGNDFPVNAAVNGLVFSTPGAMLKQKGTYLAVAADSGLHIWNIVKVDEKDQHFPGLLTKEAPGPINAPILCVTYSADGRYWAAGDAHGHFMLRDNVAGRFIPCTQGEHAGGILAMTFSPDSKTLATGGADKKLRLWDVSRLAPR